MKKSEARIFEMLVRVRQHGLTRTADFPAESCGRKLYDDVDAAVKTMEKHAATQSLHAHAAKEKTTQKKVANAALHRAMEAINRTARAMSRLMPGLEERFRLPSNRNGQTWIAAARAFVTEVDPIKDEFIKRGLSPDFVEDLTARIAAVGQFADGRAKQSSGRIASTTGVAKGAEEGVEAVRELDAIVRNVYADDPAEMAEWESASHIERAPRRAGAVKPSGEPEPSQV